MAEDNKRDRIYTLAINYPDSDKDSRYFTVYVLAYDYEDAKSIVDKHYGEGMLFSPLNPINFEDAIEWFMKNSNNLKVLDSCKKEKKLKDAPLYEVEYKNGEAYVDIPDDEIKEFIKNRLIQIANSPRLIEKYRHGLEDLLEADLQEYANKQFYEEGKGEVIEDSDEPIVILQDPVFEYKKLQFISYGRYYPPTWGPNGGSPGEYEEIEHEVDYDYEVDSEEVIEALMDMIDPNSIGIEDPTEDQIYDYIANNFDELVEKYRKDLMNHFEEDAAAAAQEEYSNRHNYEYDPDDY